jgi:hypothetical protein
MRAPCVRADTPGAQLSDCPLAQFERDDVVCIGIELAESAGSAGAAGALGLTTFVKEPICEREAHMLPISRDTPCRRRARRGRRARDQRDARARRGVRRGAAAGGAV